MIKGLFSSMFFADPAKDQEYYLIMTMDYEAAEEYLTLNTDNGESKDAIRMTTKFETRDFSDIHRDLHEETDPRKAP